jgi:cyclase
MMKKTILLPSLLLFFLVPAVPAQNFDRIRIKTTPLAENVFLLASRAGGNLCACVGEEGIFLVDSEYTELNGKVRESLAALSGKPVRYVLNTHWHFDHTGGNAGFAGSGALIVAHENVRKRLAKGQMITIIDADIPPAPKEALPAVTFNERIAFRFGGEEIVVFSPPAAHTDGDGVVFFKKANVVHTGDIVFNFGYPFIDISSGGTIGGVIDAIDTILGICDDETKIVPGHGPLMTRDRLVEYVAMLRAFRAIIAAGIKSGQDLEAILASGATAELDAKWGNVYFRPPQFTEIVFLSLSKKETAGSQGARKK